MRDLHEPRLPAIQPRLGSDGGVSVIGRILRELGTFATFAIVVSLVGATAEEIIPEGVSEFAGFTLAVGVAAYALHKLIITIRSNGLNGDVVRQYAYPYGVAIIVGVLVVFSVYGAIAFVNSTTPCPTADSQGIAVSNADIALKYRTDSGETGVFLVDVRNESVLGPAMATGVAEFRGKTYSVYIQEPAFEKAARYQKYISTPTKPSYPIFAAEVRRESDTLWTTVGDNEMEAEIVGTCRRKAINDILPF